LTFHFRPLSVRPRTRTYYLRWGLLVVGIAGWAVGAALVDAVLGTKPPDPPPLPPPAVVAPANPILDGPSVDLSVSLPLPADALQPDSTVGVGDALWGALDGVGGPVAAERPSPSGTQAAETPAVVGLPTTYGDQLRLHRSLQRKPGASATLELGGFVVDETITPQGRTFYDSFYGVWRSPSVEGFYTVRIQEKPTPGRGTLVQVFVNDDTTYRTRLQRNANVDDHALQAARRTFAYVRSGKGILQIQ
jgi:hypothetical protein